MHKVIYSYKIIGVLFLLYCKQAPNGLGITGGKHSGKDFELPTNLTGLKNLNEKKRVFIPS